MRKIIVGLSIFLLAGCNNSKDKADILNGMVEDCDPGSKATLKIVFGSYIDRVEFTCEWIVEED